MLKNIPPFFYIWFYNIDDMGLLGNNLDTMQAHKTLLSEHFHIKDLGEVKQILGIAVDCNRTAWTLTIYQTRYVEDSLNRYKLNNGHTHRTPFASGTKLSQNDSPSTDEEKEHMKNFPYQNLIGTLMYAMLGTRPGIAFAVGVLSKYCANPGHAHWDQAVHVLQYLAGNKESRTFL